MSRRRRLYFLSHWLVVAVGAVISLVGDNQHEPWKTVLIAIGTSVIATGAAGMLIWVYLAQVESSGDKLNNMATVGLEQIYDRRAAQIRQEYASRLSAAKNNIDIMGFGLKDFRRDYIDDLGALAARAKVRILLLDPASPYASQRDKEESQSVGTIKDEIEEFIVQFKQKYSQPSGNLQLRIYDSLPMVNIFRIDGDLFWGPYLVGKASGNTITVRVSRRGIVYEQMVQHFENVWDRHSRVIV